MPFFVRRVIETVGGQIALSVVFALLFFSGVLPQKVWIVTVAMIVCLLINVIFLYICLKGYLISVHDLKKYYIVNLIVIAILAALSILFAGLNLEPFFTWVFFPFKLFYIRLATSKLVSAIAISIVFLVFTAILPWIVRLPPEDLDDDFDDD